MKRRKKKSGLREAAEHARDRIVVPPSLTEARKTAFDNGYAACEADVVAWLRSSGLRSRVERQRKVSLGLFNSVYVSQDAVRDICENIPIKLAELVERGEHRTKRVYGPKHARVLVHEWLLNNGPVRAELVSSTVSEGTGLNNDQSRRALLSLLACGAADWGLTHVRARSGVDPMSREDHTDCWPVCTCFEKQDKEETNSKQSRFGRNSKGEE